MVSKVGSIDPHEMKAYDLQGRDEDYVQQEERHPADILLDELPAIVFAANLISSLAPIVIGQPQRPDYAEGQHIVHSLRR